MDNQELTPMSEVINKIIDRTTNIQSKSDDYLGDDGLMYCSNCHTRKQIHKEISGELRILPIMCDCREKQVKKEDEEKAEQQHRIYINNLKSRGVTDKAYFQWTFASDDNANKKLTEICHKYVDNWDAVKKANQGIIFSGGVGTGKTFYACCIGNALLDKGVSVLITNFAKILNTLQNFYSEEKEDFIKSLQKYSLIIIDDLGVERSTDFALEQMFNIIDTRYRSGLPLIITTNLTPKELKNPSELKIQRIYDRILEKCAFVIVDGISRRKNLSEQNRTELSGILGIDL